jgi:hypothetical protein
MVHFPILRPQQQTAGGAASAFPITHSSPATGALRVARCCIPPDSGMASTADAAVWSFLAGRKPGCDTSNDNGANPTYKFTPHKFMIAMDVIQQCIVRYTE